MFDGYLYFKICRVMSSIVAKYNVNKNFNCDIFTHLFEICIAPVILYGHEAYGYNVFKNVIEFNISPCLY